MKILKNDETAAYSIVNIDQMSLPHGGNHIQKSDEKMRVCLVCLFEVNSCRLLPLATDTGVELFLREPLPAIRKKFPTIIPILKFQIKSCVASWKIMSYLYMKMNRCSLTYTKRKRAEMRWSSFKIAKRSDFFLPRRLHRWIDLIQTVNCILQIQIVNISGA